MSLDPLPFVLLALASVIVLGPIAPVPLALLAAVLAMMRARYRTTPARVVEAERLPRPDRLLLGAAGEALASLGFEGPVWLEAPAMRVDDPVDRVFSLAVWHPGQATMAVATVSVVPNGIPVQVAFVTASADGGSLRTVNRLRWMQPPERRGQTVEDPHCDDLTAQWDAHLQALAGREGVVTDRGEALRRLVDASSSDVAYEHLCSIGWMREMSQGTWRYTLAGALRQAWRALRVPPEVRAALGRPWRQDPAPDPVWVGVVALQQASAELALAAARGVPIGTVALVVAVGAALAASSPAPAPAAFGAALAALVMVGLHLLAKHLGARSIGLSGPTALLMPLAEALALGERRMPSATRQAVVLLAVPVVEIAIGVIALASAPAARWPASIDDAMRMLGLVALALGAMDLLPFRSCAGLRLLELGALARVPRALPLIGAAILAITLIPMIAFGVPGASALLLPLMALLLPALFWLRRSGVGVRLAASVREAVGSSASAPMTASEALTAVAFELSNGVAATNLVRGSWRGQAHAAATAYASLVDGRPSGVRAGGLLAAHGLALVLAAGTVVGAVFPPPAADGSSARPEGDIGRADRGSEARPAGAPPRPDPRSDFRHRFDEETDPAGRWAMLESPEARALMRGDDPLDGIWLASNREHLLPLLPDDHPARTAAEREGRLSPASDPAVAQQQLLSRAALSTDPDVVRGSLRRVLDAAGNLRPCDGDRLFEGVVTAYDRLRRGFPAALIPEDHAVIARLLDGMLAPGCGDPMQAQRAILLASAFARASLAAGRRAQADAAMARLAAAGAGRTNPVEGIAHAWYLLEKGKPAAAIDAAREVLAASPHPSPASPGGPSAAAPDARDSLAGYVRQEWHTVAGWAELELGRPTEADAHFREALDLKVQAFEAGRAREGAGATRGGEGSPGLRDPRERLGPQSLDRLVALRRYDPAAADRLRAALLDDGLARHGGLRMWEEESMPYGWGARRWEAHQRLLDELRAEARARRAR